MPRIQPVPVGRVALAVATWNMDAGRGDLLRFVSDLETGKLTARQPEEVALLLQEAVAEHASEMAELASLRGWTLMFEPVRFDGTRTRGNAILSSRPLTGRTAIRLPTERQHRGAVAASIDVAGETLFLVSAHLENRVSFWGALFSDLARARQAKALIEAIPPRGGGVLGGDFNAWLGLNEPAWDILRARFDDTTAIKRTPTFHGRLVLDQLLFDLPSGWHAATHVVADSYGSDHHPVVGMLIVEPSG